jgi:hypothetical protein
MKQIWIVVLISILSACVTDTESTEKKSALNYLNGEHYQATSFIGPVPVGIERRMVSTKISGQAFIMRTGIYQPPLRDSVVVLMEGNSELQREDTDHNGHFEFVLDLASGSYTIRADASPYVGEVNIKVDSYEVRKVVLQVK